MQRIFYSPFFIMKDLTFLYWPEDMDPYFDPERRTNKHRMETMKNELLPVSLAQVLSFISDCSAADLDAIESACADREETLDVDSDGGEDEDEDDDGQPDELKENEDFANDNLLDREEAEGIVDKID